MTDYRIILTTAGSADEAERIAAALVEAQLAACVNIISPITSVYRWKGSVQKEQEWLLLIKTTASAFETISKKIRELLGWIAENVKLP